MAIKKIVVGIAALISAAAVQAAVIPLSTTVSLGQQLSTGQSQNVQVNVNNILANLGLTSASIVSGSLTVTAYSQADYAAMGSTSPNGYVQTGAVNRQYQSCNGNHCTTKTAVDKTHLKDVTANYVDLIADTMLVSAGDSFEADSATEFSESYSDFGAKAWDKTTGSNNGGYQEFYHRNRNHYLALSGSLEVLLNLDGKALGDLAGDGILDLAVSSFLGKFTVTGVRLDFEAQDRAVPDADIPLPTSLLLTGLGLAALATVRRRKA
jgi:hypothetical protein